MDPRHAWYSRPPTPSYPAAPPPPPPPPPYPAAPPPPLNPCPICSTPHFPFCPPPYPSPPQTPFQPHFRYHPPPPPPPPQHPPPLPPPPPPPYDPYHHGPPIIPPPPWNPIVNPNSNNNNNNNNNNYNNSNYAYPGVKRLRVEESGVSNDDERRLKLIREHGGSSGRLCNIIDGFELNHCTSFNRREDSVYDQDDSYNMPKRYRVVNDSNGYGDSINRFGLGNNSKCDDSFGRQQHGMEMKSGYYGSPYRNERDGVNRLHNQSSEVFHGQQFSVSPSPPVPPPRAVENSRSRLPDVIVSTSLPEANQFSSTYLPGVQTIHHALQKTYPRECEQLSSQSATSDDKKIVDASLLLKHPHRTTRPDHIVVILRGLPGSGKSYLAKMFRDLEVENGGRAPRIHTMDDYFMMEVEKIEESEASKSSSSVRGRKPATKIVMEYCYEPEMEEAYRSSLLKAFKKTLDEGVYSFVIVDDRNLRVADFVQFWATAKRSGYEVYLLEAAYKDPVGCAARNIHGFTQDDIRKMADQWEEAPSMYLQLDIRSLLHGDKLLDSEMQEVDMDTGEGDYTCVPSFSDESNAGRVGAHSTSNGPPGDDKNKDTTGPPCPKEDEAKELGKSKWSNDLDDDDDAPRTHARERNLNTLPGLNQSYRKKGKSVCWGDQVVNTGFSIGAAKVAYTSSLVIGPGAGYNLNTNPLAEADKMASKQHTGKMQNVLREQLLAEHESFKAVFDKCRQRIGGFDMDEE